MTPEVEQKKRNRRWRRSLRALSLLFVSVILLFAILLGYCFYDIPLGPEYEFRYRLSEKASNGDPKIGLAELARFEWETVCSIHPYDGPLRLAEYGKTYEAPPEAAHGGVWCLLFVASDGSPTYIWGSCVQGGAYISDVPCLSRSEAIIWLDRAKGRCPEYAYYR